MGAATDPAFGQIREAARSSRVPIFERGAGSPAVAVGDLLIEPFLQSLDLFVVRAGVEADALDGNLTAQAGVVGQAFNGHQKRGRG